MEFKLLCGRPTTSTKKYTDGDLCYIDRGGMIKAKCVKVIEPGPGFEAATGCIRVEVMETRAGYRQGETLDISAKDAVPRPHRVEGEFFYRVNTAYEWVKHVEGT